MKPYLICFYTAFVWFSIVSVDLSAQEYNPYKDLIKESINLDAIMNLMDSEVHMDSLSRYIELDVNKKPLLVLGYNYELNSLILNHKDSLSFEPKYSISPAAYAFYTNTQSFDPNSTETATDIIANGILTPIGALATFNILALADYLMRIGLLPSEPFVSKQAKSEKTLKEIKSIYNID